MKCIFYTNTNPKRGFTLVELIVVVSILSILGTLGFISLQNYSTKARDSKRITDIQVIGKGLETKIAAGNSLPEPDERKISLTLSGAVIRIQGVAEKNTLTALQIQSSLSDPLTNQSYTYLISGNRSHYQLYTELELSEYSAANLLNPTIPIAFAESTPRYPYLLGDSLGILVSSGGTTPINTISTTPSSIELKSATNIYTAIFDTDDIQTTSGSTLFSNMSTRSLELLANAEYTKHDNSLLGYWNFNEASGSAAFDSSNKANTGTIGGYFNRARGKMGQAVDFYGSGGYIIIPDNPNLAFSNQSFTVSIWGNYRDFTYPKASFMIKKGGTCYLPGAPGWSVGHGYYPNGISVCYSDGINGAAERLIEFNPGYRPSEIKGTWTHLAVVFDLTSKRISFYVNGIRQSQMLDIGSVTGSVDNTYPLTIGTMHGWQTDGTIDDIRIYERVLTEKEIQLIANQPALTRN